MSSPSPQVAAPPVARPARAKAAASPFAGLARRRPDLTSPHFALSFSRGMSDTASRPLFAMAVAKRLLPRAVDRNAMKRVTREAWRARCLRAPCPPVAFVRVRQVSADWKRIPDGQRKRAWRAELDALLARMVLR